MSLPASLQQLFALLPRHAEEGRLRETVSEDTLIHGIGDPAAPAIVAMMRRVFESLALLDCQHLREGKWAFVSFPASLLARSLISAWAAPGQLLVESGYWESDSEHPAIAEEQRLLLHTLETRRQRFHPAGAAQPIRFVHVAWGVIRLAGRFLLYRREDIDRPEAKRFVFPGGRFRPSDMPAAAQAPAALRELSGENPVLVVQSLPTTLARELHEELGLHRGEDYTAQLWKVLQPYYAVEGSGNRHALTRYNLVLFVVSLTAQGEANLLETIAADPPRYPWFSIGELSEGMRADGATAFIDALHADMGAKFAQQFDGVPDSSGVSFAIADENDAVELPEAPDSPFRCGKTGRERECWISLARADWELLLLLGWCGRGFPVNADPVRVLVLGGGWIRLLQEEDMVLVKALATTLAAAELPLIQFAGRALRLAVKPEHLYFAAAGFSYTYRPSPVRDGGYVDLILGSVATAFGKLEARELSFPIPPQLANVIEAIEVGRDPGSILKIREAGDLPGQNRQSITRQVRRLGLRRLLRMPGNEGNKDLRIAITARKGG